MIAAYGTVMAAPLEAHIAAPIAFGALTSAALGAIAISLVAVIVLLVRDARRQAARVGAADEAPEPRLAA